MLQFPNSNIRTLLAAAANAGKEGIIVRSDDNPLGMNATQRAVAEQLRLKRFDVQVNFPSPLAIPITILTERPPDHFLVGPQADETQPIVLEWRK